MKGRIFLLLLLLTACSPERRLSAFLKKHPELVKTETTYRFDTTIVMGIGRDTVMKTQITKDTVVIKDRQLEIRYYNDGKTTYLKGRCDTVVVIKEIPVKELTVAPKSLTMWDRIRFFFKDLLWFILIAFFSIIILKLGKNIPIVSKLIK